MKVYLSGPITGLLPNEAQGWREYAAERLLECGFEVRNPLRGERALQPRRRRYLQRNYPAVPQLSDKAFLARDRYDVLSCDIVLCNLLGTETVSIGSLFELAWAMNAQRLVIIVMEEKGNVHNHPFTREAGIIFSDLDEAIDYLLSCGGEAADEEEGD